MHYSNINHKTQEKGEIKNKKEKEMKIREKINEIRNKYQ